MEWSATLDEYEKLITRMNTPRVVIDNAVCPTATLVKVDSARKQRSPSRGRTGPDRPQPLHQEGLHLIRWKVVHGRHLDLAVRESRLGQ